MRWMSRTIGAITLSVLAVSSAQAFSPSRWVADRIGSYVSESFGVPIDIGDLDVDLLSTTPGGTLSGVSIGDGTGGTLVSNADVSFEIDAGFVTGGDLVFERLSLSNADIDLVVDEDGRGNWESLLEAFGAEDDEASVAPEETASLPTIRSLDVENVDVRYTDRALDRSASLTLSAGGSTSDPARPLTLEARGDVDGLPARADATLVPRGDPIAPSGSLDVDARLIAGDTTLTVEGSIDDPVGLGTLDLSISMSAPDGEDVEALAAVGLPGIGALSLDGSVARTDGDWRLDDVVASVGDTRARIDGRLGDPTSNAGLAPDLSFELSGPDGADVAPLVAAFTGTELPPLPAFAASGAVTSEDGDWTLDGVEANFGDTRLSVNGGLGDPLVDGGLAPDLSFELSAPDGTDVAPLVEAFTGTELPPLPAFAASGAVASENGDWMLDGVEATLGDATLTASGTLGDPLAPDGLDPRIDFAFAAPDLDDIEAVAGTELPSLAPLEFSGKLRRDGNDWVLRRFDALVGSTALEGDARVDPSTTPPTAYANVIVPVLHLDELLDAVDDGTDDGIVVASDEEVEEDTGGRLLPNDPLDLRPLARAVDGALRLRVRDIASTSLPLDSFAARLAVDGDEIALSSLRLGVGGGTVGGSVDLDTAPVPAEGVVDLRIRGIDLKEIATALDIDDTSFGAIGGRVKYWIRGDSLASFAASADGGLFLLMRGGELDALLAELASIDVVESLLLLADRGKTLTNIDCGYVGLQSASGRTEIEHFVLDTADTAFVADGTIDLNDESLDVVLEPHPKDASLLEVNTGVRVSGTFDDIAVAPGVELGARAAAAAALAAIAAPAAALLAFVETGGAEDSPYCDALEDELEKSPPAR